MGRQLRISTVSSFHVRGIKKDEEIKKLITIALPKVGSEDA